MADAYIIDTDHGYAAFVNTVVNTLSGTRHQNQVRVGYFSGEQKGKRKVKGKGVTIAEYALINEFGAPGAGIPARPFMRRAFDLNQSKYEAAINRWRGMVLTGQMTMREMLVRLGNQSRNDIVKTILKSKDWAAPNAESTVEKKGSTGPLRDLGPLKNLVWFETTQGGTTEVIKHPGAGAAEGGS